MIRINALYKQFGKNEVLKGIDLDLATKGITAIMGPNGSGKTTLIKCILGLVLPQSGSIQFNGELISGKHKYRSEISHLPQIARFPENLTGNELIRMIKDLRPGSTREEYFVSLFQLEDELGKKLGNLSGGNLQKINLLLAFMYDSPVIILDEPSTGLDPVALIRLKKFLLEEKQRGKIILITTHIMSFVEEMADHIVFILDGEIYFNGPKDTLVKDFKKRNLEETIAEILMKQNNEKLVS